MKRLQANEKFYFNKKQKTFFIPKILFWVSQLLFLPQGAAKVMAKDLVRTRSHVQKMFKMKTQLQAVSLRLQTVKSQNAMATAIKGVARVCI